MSESAQKQLIRELDQYVHEPNLTFCLATEKLSKGRTPRPNSYAPGVPHFEIVLTGELPLVLPAGEEYQERRLRPGETFCLFPSYCVERRHNTTRELLVINIHPDGIECYHSHHHFVDGTANSNRVSYHTSTPLEIGGTQLLKALEHYAYTEPDEVLPLLFRAFLVRIRKNIQQDQTRERLRRQFTYKMILQHMQEHCCRGINRKTIAAEFGLSPDYLTHLFKQFGSESFHAALIRLRMEQALHYLDQPTANVAAAARACGFDDPAYFIKVFRRAYGLTPGEYRLRAGSALR